MFNTKNTPYQNLEIVYESPRIIIYRAIHVRENRSVILKILKKDFPTPEELYKFNKEYNLLRMFKNGGVINVYDFLHFNNLPAIAMEDIGGDSLKHILESERITVDIFLPFAIQLVEIIGNIHKRNIIHKDINPANIIWNREKDCIRIIDFDIATEFAREITSVKNPSVLEGTLTYISPEQTGRMNRFIDYRSDFYSLGVTFYRILTGKLPFETDDLLKLVHSHIAIMPPPPLEINSTLPIALSNIVMKLLNKNAEERYQHAYGLKYDLEQCKELLHTREIKSFVIGKKDISGKFHIPQKLYGREKELDLLLSAFKRVTEGNTELLLVEGVSGIGKSFLINEIHKPILAHNGYFIGGKFDELKKNVPYNGIIQAFTGLAKQILAEDQQKIVAWKEKIIAELGANCKLLTNMVPTWEFILGKQQNLVELPPNEAQNRFNLTFQNLFRILARKENPLVLFLDDLQWADLASLDLLKLFITDSNQKHLLFIGAYRDNEISKAHPLFLVLEEIQESGLSDTTITLKPLTLEAVSSLTSETLHRGKEEIRSLVEILYQKTRGNPFFVKEFLSSLYSKGLIDFSFEKKWFWDLAAIKKMPIAHNVVELMIAKISILPQESQHLLKTGACIGNHFNLTSLLTVSGRSLEAIEAALKIVVKEGMVNNIDNRYLFSHDRVQEAAYAMIDAEEKSKLHYLIGKTELENTKQEDLEEKIFYIVNQFIAGIVLVKEEHEKHLIRQLLLAAGKKAHASNAYKSALQYLQVGISLLPETGWQDQYELTLALHQEAVSSAQQCAEYETMNTIAQMVFDHARSILDTVAVYESQIFACRSQSKLPEAVHIGLFVLRKFGINAPEKTGKLRILYEYLITKLFLRGKSSQKILTLPEIKDPDKIAALRILAALGPAVYQAAPEIFTIMLFSAIRYCVKHGNCRYVPFIYAAFGFAHSGVLEDFVKGYEFGKLASDIIKKFSYKEEKTRSCFLIWFFTNHWKTPLHKTSKPLLEAYKVGLETGDLEFASLSIYAYLSFLFLSGENLSFIVNEGDKYEKIINKLKQNVPLNFVKSLLQTICNLQGKSDNPYRLRGSIYNQDKMLPEHKKAKDGTAIYVMFFHLLMINYFLENYEEALTFSLSTQPYKEAAISVPHIPCCNFLTSLVYLALYSSQTNAIKRKYLSLVRKNQKKMKKWALHCPENNAHKYHLVEAELARVKGKFQKAIQHYTLAIKLAGDNKFVQEEALALELYAKFWLDHDEEQIGGLYLKESYQKYHYWGATAKLQQMEKKYHQVLSLKPNQTETVFTTAANTSTTTSDIIDLSTIIKTSQALSSETDLATILKTIITFSISNAGAQRGVLLIINEETQTLYIEAEGKVNKGVEVLNSISVEKNMETLSLPIINYVNRTGEKVILNNAHQEGGYQDNPYIRKNRAKSILCIPIIHKGNKIGILYLENNLTANVFTNERIKLLQIIASQAAISIENARLIVHRENSAKLEKEMEIAANIQTGLLPKDMQMEGYDIAAYMEPADTVGGDYYDVIKTDNRNWIIIGDVSGHGVPAGLIMMMVQTSIHVVLEQNPEIRPAALLSTVNKIITENIQLMGESKYMTITALAAKENGEIQFAGLHQDILLYRKETANLELVETEGMWLGIMDDVWDVMIDNTLTLNPGDTMVLYTDGITEARIKQSETSDHEMFELERLKTIVINLHKHSCEDIKNNILAELNNFECTDDITMIILQKNKMVDR